MTAESKPQPTIKLRIFTNKSDYDHMNMPYCHVKSTSVKAITDTGAQSSLMGMKTSFLLSTKCMRLTTKALISCTNEMLPFKPLLSPKTPFKGTDTLQEAFEKSKIGLVEAIEDGVRIFDPRRKCLSPDWSCTGIGYWLRQQYCSCLSDTPDCCKDGWKITLAGSRFLRTSERPDRGGSARHRIGTGRHQILHSQMW